MRLWRRFGLLWGVLSGGFFAQPAAADPEPAESAKAAKPPSDNQLSELLWVNADVGAQYIGLEQLHLSEELFPSTVRSADVGPTVSLGAGVRFVFITLGPRFRYGSFRDWDVWSLDAELGFRVPLGRVEPSLVLGAGYSKVGRLQRRSVRVQGYNIRLGFGADYYFDKMFSVGASATGDLLGLTRPGVDLNEQTGSTTDDVYKLEGSGIGIALVGSVNAGFHL